MFAGAMDFESGLKVVRKRGQAMQAAALATPSGMTSVLGLDETAVDELCRRIAPLGRLWKANLLGPGNIVVSGDATALEHVEPIAIELGAMKVVPLKVAGAFHSELMKPADEQLARVLAQTSIVSPRSPFIPTSTPPHSDPDDIRRTLVAQVSKVFAGKTRCAGCSRTALTPSTKSGRAGSSPACSNASSVRLPAPAFRRDRMWRN